MIINEEEYTKITTPRQDVLFKKGYLSRPKKYTTTPTNTNESGTATGSSSVNGATTDGSEAAIGSGTVSTAESVTSDSTYLTDGHLLDYPAPLPYFGYIDHQSGVLVMNGFAVDNSGFSYMNGGQTYIYPPNYHCPSSSFNEGGPTENADELDPAASICDPNQATELLDGVSETAPTINGLEASESDTRFNGIPEETVEGLVNGNDGEDSNQQVPQQQSMLSPLDGSYDYAQFYNALYYPGCMVAPFPVLGNEMYYDQFGGVSEEDQARQQSFRKRKKRYRNWDEYPPTFYPDGTVDTMYQYPHVSCFSENGISELTEVPADVSVSEPNPSDRTVTTLPPITENVDTTNQNSSELPSSHQTEPRASSSLSSHPPNTQKVEDSCNSSTVCQPSGKPRSHVQKTRKKDLIEMTRAFAEQNIDLTRPVSLYKSSDEKASETNEWKTVRNGKEITIKEDREVDSKSTIKNRKEESEPVANEKLFFDDCKPDQAIATGVSDETKRGKKDVASKKGKKTAKGKGKKQKKPGSSAQHTGFEVIEPEFFSKTKIEEPPVSYHEKVDADDEEDQASNNNEHEAVQISNSNEYESIDSMLVIEQSMEEDGADDDDEQCLENDLQGIQLSDLQIEECCPESEECHQNEEEVKQSIGSESQESEILSVSEQLIIQNSTPDVEANVEMHINVEVHEVPPLDLTEANEADGSATTSNQANTEDIDLIETKLMVDCNLPLHPTESTSVIQLDEFEVEVEEEEQKCKHFSSDQYSEDFDSGVQSPAAFTNSSSDSKDRKFSASSTGSQDIHLTDAVTRWLSETLNNKKLEEMFVLPENPLLLHRIYSYNYNVLNGDDTLVLSSDTYSSSSEDEVDDSFDSDYMSDVQVKNREQNGGPEGQQKTELKKDQLAKQTANGHCLLKGGDHSNHKQKRCIIM